MVQFPTKIKGLSESRRMPRLNKIRLGAKLANTNGVEYPVELPFFLLPEEVTAVHGSKTDLLARAKELGIKNKNLLDFISKNSYRMAEELPVMVPVEETEHSFPQSYSMYGSSAGLQCIGNGETATFKNPAGEWCDKQCPCPELKTNKTPKGKCSIKARLQVILPEVSAGGVFQIDIGSINSIIDINSGIDYVRSMVGRVAMIPLRLKRIPTETHHDNKKQTHYTCQLTFSGDIKAVVALREKGAMLTHKQILTLEEPDYSNPKLDPVDAVYEQTEELKIMIDELGMLKSHGKMKKHEIEIMREAIEANDEDAIKIMHEKVVARQKTGSTQADVAAKLGSKKEKVETSGEPTAQNQQQDQDPGPQDQF